MQFRIAAWVALATVSLSAWGAESHNQQKKAALPPAIRSSAEALGMVRWTHSAEENLDLIARAEWTASGVEHRPQAGGTWPEFKVKRLVFGVNYRLPAVRVDFVRVGPDGREERSIHVVRDKLAWNETEPGIGATPAPADAVAQRRRDVAILPHGFMRAVLQADPKSVRISRERGKTVITAPFDGITLKGTLGADQRPEKVEMPIKHPVLGDTVVEATYQGYKDFEGYEVFFPAHIVLKIGGRVLYDLTVSKHETAPYLVWPVPENIRQAANR
jgi:hypothetical protein